MKPFRQHVAIAMDGGGIRGVMVARALAILEDRLGQSSHEIFPGAGDRAQPRATWMAGEPGQQPTCLRIASCRAHMIPSPSGVAWS